MAESVVLMDALLHLGRYVSLDPWMSRAARHGYFCSAIDKAVVGRNMPERLGCCAPECQLLTRKSMFSRFCNSCD